jgi:hypothetical protein
MNSTEEHDSKVNEKMMKSVNVSSYSIKLSIQNQLHFCLLIIISFLF